MRMCKISVSVGWGGFAGAVSASGGGDFEKGGVCTHMGLPEVIRAALIHLWPRFYMPSILEAWTSVLPENIPMSVF